MDEIKKVISDYFKQKKKNKIRDKEDKIEFKKELKEREKFEKELDKEIKKKDKEEKKEKRKTKLHVRIKNNIVDFWKDVKDTKDEEELKAYMTPEQLEKRKQEKKEDKMFAIGGIGALAMVITVAFVIAMVIREAAKTDLENKVIPAMDKYMQEKFPNSSDKRVSINYLTYKEKNDEGKEVTVTSDIVLATYESGLHLMSIKDDVIGDDVNTNTVYKEYTNFIKEKLDSVSFYTNNPLITYNPYVVDYYYYKDYIDVLPANKSFEEMYNDSKLTIVDMIEYEGELDLEIIQDVLSLLSDNSFYYLIQVEGDLVYKFSIVTKDDIKTYNITTSRYLGDGDVYYELDQTMNLVTNMSITVVSSLLNEEETIKYTNVRRIEPTTSRAMKDDDRTSYYMIKIGDKYNKGKYTFLDSEKLEEIKVDDYPVVYYFPTSMGTFVFGTENIVIANKNDYEAPAWYCRFGICK